MPGTYISPAESGLYYLNSRYYDAEVGRFISADGVVSGAGGSVQGYNIYSYCMNNPVNMSDASGHWPKWVKNVADWVNNKIIEPVKTTFGDIGSKVIVDIKNYDKDNTDVEKVYKSNYFSSYKGTTVIRHSSSVLSSWAICGTIFLNHSDDRDSYIEHERDLNHEYGHILQEKEYGTWKYLLSVGIPSVSYNFLSRGNDFLDSKYYDMPWEYNADVRGDVNREHWKYSGIMSNLYFWTWEVIM